MSSSKQSKSLNLPSGQNVFEARRLTAAFLGMAKALSSRPEPRQPWDNVAMGRTIYKGHEALACAKSVVRAAIVTGHWPTIETTARAVVHFFDEMKYVALRDYSAIADKEITLDDAIIKASKETGEALHAILESSLHSGDPALTVKEIDEAIEWLATLRAKMTPPSQAKQLSRGALALV